MSVHLGMLVLIHDHKDTYGVDVVGSGSPATNHDDGGPFADEPLSLSLLYPSNEAQLYIVGPVLLAFSLVQQRVHTSVHVALSRRGGGGGETRENRQNMTRQVLVLLEIKRL